ncbi:MAG: CoA activase [Bryobacterales bacterium]|nr:CoA activase [Bryobacterales bacterium]MBV9399086.1 CoA activase [Bryobacterales bacterium]
MSYKAQFSVGLDVGSTTVKACVLDTAADHVVWQDYQRHETKQPEKVLEFLRRMEAEAGVRNDNTRIFMTGSGGTTLAERIGAKFVQEVTAVSLAVEKQHPEVYSVIELGGQDAKIIVFKDDDESGRKKKIPSMNDKCAGGTGAVIDKINAKLKIPVEELGNQGYNGIKLHKVAGKCGVFAETDINGLQKEGTPPDQLMASLFEAIVLQNLSVLTRGHTLRPHVLLLGGPNSFIRGMREAWIANIPRMWKERKVEIPEGMTPDQLIKVPQNAQYFAALGAIEFGRDEDDEVGRYTGTEKLAHYIDYGRAEEKAAAGGSGLAASSCELDAFEESYRRKKFVPAPFRRGQVVAGFVGVDGGSTSTKAALVDENGDILCKAYQLSNGNPIEDTKQMFEKLRAQVEEQGAKLEVLGVGTTGYAKDILKDVLHGDVALVETVAHTESAIRFYDDPHVIVDVGGQDIKLIVLKNGRVKDFKLNTQCSAGNGYFLQSTAEAFNIPVEHFAQTAFSAQSMPVFGYGCAVFMQSDIVNFQRQGWRAEEILAGLAAVLPKNVFLYVASIPNLANLGTRFVLQGGTQNNLAVVKAEVDFINSSFRASGKRPEIIVHEHCGESGAIGAAVEAVRLWKNGRQTSFIGLDAVRKISYRTTRNEDTRCYFCKNNCLRTFIDVNTNDEAPVINVTGPATRESLKASVEPLTQIQLSVGSTETVKLPEPKFQEKKTKVPLREGEQRLIIATCEKGTVEDIEEMKGIKGNLDAVKAQYPNLVEWASREAFRFRNTQPVADPLPQVKWWDPKKAEVRKRIELMQRRKEVRIAMPRVFYMYSHAQIFNGYFQALGIPSENIVYSDYTSGDLYRAGANRGAVDPCFPAKIGISHVHNLLFVKALKKKIDYIFYPMFDVLPTKLVQLQGSNACPTITASPETVKAAFTKENDVFAEHGAVYLDPILNLADRTLFAQQMYAAFRDILGLGPEENDRAIQAAFDAQEQYEKEVQKKARAVLEDLEREDRIGLVLLARVYHHDPGLNHEILDEFQKLGYPIFSQSTLPYDDDILERLFGEEVRRGEIKSPLEIQDVWKNSYSVSTNHKVWAAKFTARHPNLVALEMSSFKCGHDAPIYGVIEGIIEKSGTPYFSFKDLDENKPTGSIKIRVETIDYFLRRYREDLVKRRTIEREIDDEIRALARRLEEHPSEGLELAAAG